MKLKKTIAVTLLLASVKFNEAAKWCFETAMRLGPPETRNPENKKENG